MRDLGFDFGPDPTSDEALVGYVDGFVHRPGIPQAGLVLVAMAAYLIYLKARAAKERRDAVIIVQGRDAGIAARRVQALGDMRGRDPGFEEAAFLEHASAIYVKVQSAWSSHELPRARHFVSDGFYERLRGEIEVQEKAKVRHRLSELEVKETEALAYGSGYHYDAIAVRFKVSALRERLNLQTSAKLDGAHETYEEVWTFVRRLGATTAKKKGAAEGQCPSCGAPLTVADGARCEGCKAWVNSGEFDWIAVKSTVPWEWRFPDPKREVTGWPELREKDPEVSLTALEDRAAVVFWRMLAAQRTKDSAGLRGLAAPEFIAALKYDEEPFEPLLGAVETVAFVAGEDFDEVHIQLRWENRRRRRTDYLIFQRRAGVETFWKSGLSATRCHSCGAPAEGADQTVCGYCRRPVGWVLSRVEAYGEWKRPDGDPGTLVLPGAEFDSLASSFDTISALASLAASDRAVHDRERAYLRAVAARRGVPEERVDELLARASAGDLTFDPGHDGGLLRGLVRAALCDGFVEEGERTLLSRAALRSGVHELELREMIREERAAMAARARDLVKRLR